MESILNLRPVVAFLVHLLLVVGKRKISREVFEIKQKLKCLRFPTLARSKGKAP